MTSAPVDKGGPLGLDTAQFLSDPYPTYAWLREHAPVHYAAEWNGFLITRYADVAAGFREPRFSSNRAAAYASQLPEAVRQQLGPLICNLSNWVLFSDPPLHTRLRGLLNRAFVPRLIETMRPRLIALVENLVTAFSQQDDIDIIEALAVPLPVLMIGEIMGVPASDRNLLKQWSDVLAAFLGIRQHTPETIAEALTAVREMEAYFRGLLIERRRRPPKEDDLLSALLNAEEQGTLLSEQELLSTCSAVLFGGHETTTNLLGNSAWLLAKYPEMQESLRKNPAAMPAAVEEFLRFDSAVQRQGRIASEDLELHGQKIAKGQRVWLVIGAANRDAAQFPEPDRLNISRTDNRHLSFGYGSHFCIGAALARLEGQLGLNGLLRTLPAFELPEQSFDRIDNLTVRGFKHLHLRRRK